jgi:protein-tyrosine phosphatase
LGAQSALQTGHEFDAVVSLSRVGMEEGNLDFTNHIRVSVLDSDEPELNPHLEFQFRTVATFIKDRLSAGQKVLLHCVHAYTRTPSFAIAYLMLAEDLEYEQAESRVRELLPAANLHEPFGSTLRRLT